LIGQTISHYRILKTEEITGFRWSPDAKDLAVVRYRNSSDVILLRDSAVPTQ
jgi:hypothetical protein